MCHVCTQVVINGLNDPSNPGLEGTSLPLRCHRTECAVTEATIAWLLSRSFLGHSGHHRHR